MLGVVKDESATSATLALPDAVEQIFRRKDIVETRCLAGSLMPSFASALAPSDMADLLAWLKSGLNAP